MSGYVRLHRALIGHPAFRNDAEAMAFAWLIMRAAWKPVRVRYKDRGICLDRGQLAISVRDFASAMDRDKAWIERLLKRLRGEAMIESTHETGVNIITISNYNEYQLERDTSETRSKTRARQTRDTEQGSEEGKEVSSDASHPHAHPFPRPEWAEPQVWKDFLANRRKKRLTNSVTAYAGFLADIARWQCPEWPPPRLLEFAVRKGWAGIYNPREDRNDGRPGKVISLRGTRPDPALDLIKRAAAQEAAERGDPAPDWGVGSSLPSIGSG